MDSPFILLHFFCVVFSGSTGVQQKVLLLSARSQDTVCDTACRLLPLESKEELKVWTFRIVAVKGCCGLGIIYEGRLLYYAEHIYHIVVGFILIDINPSFPMTSCDMALYSTTLHKAALLIS